MTIRWGPFSSPLSLDAFLLLLSVSGYLLVREDPLAPLMLGILLPISIVYLSLDVVGQTLQRDGLQLWIFRLKLLLIFLAVLLFLLIPAAKQIACRREQGAHLCAHDGLIQTEEAVRMLLSGRNPYTEDYVGTPLERAPFTRSPNPALYHLAYLPLTIVVHTLPAAVAWRFVGWYDGRVLTIITLLLSLLLLAAFAVSRERKLSLIIVLGLNLPLLTFTAEGRNDILAMFWVLLSLYLASRGRRSLSLAVMGLGCATKQTVWFALPFYFIYLLRDQGITWHAAVRLARDAWPFYLVLVLLIGPFLVWDLTALVDDTILYLTGHSETSYPVWGMGLGFLLQLFAVVSDDLAYVPFWIPQLLLGVPVLLLLLIRQIHSNTLGSFWLGFAALQLVLAYFSRIFQNNYLSMIIVAFALAFLLGDEVEEARAWRSV